MMPRPSASRGYARRETLVFVLLSATCALGGCLSAQRQGDRYFEEGRCHEAIDFYEEAIKQSDHDPQLYQRAAQCSLRLGDFASAERYYSQSLRFGGGLDVAKELADFYVKTSNYTSAVRVYQYLLHYEDDQQALYNNLGTALMYAGQPFDAESYLLVAQQMEPGDPSPYINLGVLYDRHLRQPWLAINFYECFSQLADDAKNRKLVQQRAAELHQRWDRLYDPGILECGKPYEPAPTENVAAVREVVEPIGDPVDEDREPSNVESDEPATQPVVIERMVTAEELPPAEPTPAEATARQGDDIALGRAAYERGDWAEAISRFSAVPISRLDTPHFEMLGMAYLKQNNWARARHWLELALEGDPKPETVDALAAAHKKAGDDQRVRSLCKKYGNSPKYEKMASKFCSTKKDSEP